MRKLAFAVVAIATVAGGFVGCGGSSPRKSNGTAGAGGGSAGSGSAGSGSGGSAAGNTGEAGSGTAGSGTAGSGTAGAGTAGAGAAGAGGTAGTGAGGDAGSAAGTPGYCDDKAKKPLPFSVAIDNFPAISNLNNGVANNTWKVITSPNCDETFPDGGITLADGGTDAGDGSATFAVGDPDGGDAAADGGVADAPADMAADGPVTPPLPACYEFVYTPDACVAGGGVCWAGSIFQATSLGAAENGVCVALGATTVEFWAKASRPGARIKFGSTREGMNTTEFFLNITTSWAKYTTAIPVGEDYDRSTNAKGGVWNGFSVVGEPQDHVGGTEIFVKDIRWINQ
jgi:hypothetical protein